MIKDSLDYSKDRQGSEPCQLFSVIPSVFISNVRWSIWQAARPNEKQLRVK